MRVDAFVTREYTSKVESCVVVLVFNGTGISSKRVFALEDFTSVPFFVGDTNGVKLNLGLRGRVGLGETGRSTPEIGDDNVMR